MRSLVTVIIFMFSFSSASLAEEATSAPEKDPTYLICKLRGSVRTLRVEKKKGGPCITTYTKEGVDQQVSESWLNNRCSKVLLNIRDNLEKGNWKCKDISEARVSSSER